MTRDELAELMVRVFTDELEAAEHFTRVLRDLGYDVATQRRLTLIAKHVFNTEIMALRAAGQKEYAHDIENAFANFLRAGADLGIPQTHVLWIFAMKHRDGIVAWLRGHKSQREDVRGRINDLIVYLFILRGMIEEESTPHLEAVHPHDAANSHAGPAARAESGLPDRADAG